MPLLSSGKVQPSFPLDGARRPEVPCTLSLSQVEEALSEVGFQLKVDLHFTDSKQQ